MVRSPPDRSAGEGEDGSAAATVTSPAAGSASLPRDFSPSDLASSADDLPGLEEEVRSAVALADSVPEVVGCVVGCVVAGSAQSAPGEVHRSSCELSADRCLASAQPPCLACPSASAESRDGVSTETCPASDRPHSQPASSRRARRRQRQMARRRAEQQARRKAALFAAQLAAEGVSGTAAAALLQIARPTLRSWREDFPVPELLGEPEPRGRACLEVDVATRNEIFQFLHHVTGPAIGLPALQALFSNVPRCVLQDMLIRYRRVWHWR